MESAQPRAAGRPRDPQKDRDVLAATRELLAEVGYQQTTIVAVARRAGVGAPTIYRRWSRREALIEDAAFGHILPAPLPAPTGNLRADLRAWAEAFLAVLADPVTRAAVPGLLLAWQQEQGLYRRLILRKQHDVFLRFTEMLAAGGGTKYAETAFGFLVTSTMLRAVTLGTVGAAEHCERTADALAALVCSSWQADAAVDDLPADAVQVRPRKGRTRQGQNADQRARPHMWTSEELSKPVNR